MKKYWFLKNVCLDIWAPARARGRSTFFVSTACEKNEKTEKQSKYTRAHRRFELIFGPLGFQTYVICFVPSQVLEIAICLCSCYSHLGLPSWYSTFDFQSFVIFHAIYYHHNHHFFLLGVSCLLVGALGRSLLLIAGVCKGVRRMKKSSEIPAQAVTAHQTWKMVFNILNQIWIGFLDVHILGRES